MVKHFNFDIDLKYYNTQNISVLKSIYHKNMYNFYLYNKL